LLTVADPALGAGPRKVSCTGFLITVKSRRFLLGNLRAQ